MFLRIFSNIFPRVVALIWKVYLIIHGLGVNVEPPLTNVFTMQWFLTMFATCLPMSTVLKVWDCAMLDGSEILIRTALALWTKLAKLVNTDSMIYLLSSQTFSYTDF